MSSSVTSSRRNDPEVWLALQLLVLGGKLLFQLGQATEAQLGCAVEVALALRQLRLGLGAFDLFLELLDLADDLLLALPNQLHGGRPLAQLGDLGLHFP